MATTPPIQTVVRIPPTPFHGAKYDDYQPYTTRKSTRLSTQRAARTPSPEVLTPRKQTSSRSKKTSAVLSAAHTYSPPSSAQASPQKRSRKVMVSSATEQHDTEDEDKVKSHEALNRGLAVGITMLPTPAKTPLKKRSQPIGTSTARVLFPANRTENVDDAMPTPTKNGRRSKRHIGFLLEDDASSDGKVEIYTDWKDRVPEPDESADNPFYEKPGTQNASKRRRISGEPHDNSTKEAVQSLLKRNEGMVYVFRGKKIYRRFEDEPNGQTRLTRSGVKPRQLFPPKDTPVQETQSADEEAVTDIEDPHAHDTEMIEEALITPVETSFNTASTPPSTGRATRASTRKSALDSSPMGPEPVEAAPRRTKRGHTNSPFDSWQRKKSSSVETGKRRKRELGSPEREEVTKKARGSRI